MITNQPEIDSVDQHSWRLQRQQIVKKLKKLCQQHDFEFFYARVNCQDLERIGAETAIFVQIFDLVQDYEFWKTIDNQCRISGKRVFVITDNILRWEDLDWVKFVSDPQLLGITANYQQRPVGPIVPDKLFNCFIQRADSVRQSWFYFLYHYQLLNQGYVSYLLKQLTEYSTKTDVELYDFIHTKFELHQLENFELAYQQLRNQVPYRNFDEQHDLVPLIESVKYNLVLETYAIEDDLDCWCVTEKTLRPLQFATIPLIFGQKHLLQQLVDLGFAIIYNDHDALPWTQRQKNLLEILTNDTMAPEQQELCDIARHNRTLLGNWQAKIHGANYFEEMFESHRIVGS